ncbi:MAG: hypothetical protein ABEH47_05490 [Haloferacaceae archaeon]
MTELVRDVAEVTRADVDAFEARVEEETETLKAELRDGTFDHPQAIVGLEYELYGVHSETGALRRVPRQLLDYIGFEAEMGLHNAEMHTSPQPLNRFGVASQETEVGARLDAALDRTLAEDIRLVSDGMWTVPPVGESAREYLADSVERDGVRIAANMSDSVRYHGMSNAEYPARRRIETPHVDFRADTVLPESLTTSIQPHYQVPVATDFPTYYRYAIRVAGPVLALGVNSPFLPPSLYDDAPAEEIIADGWMENRIPVFEGVLNPSDGRPDKVRFPADVETVAEAVDRIADDDPVVPMSVEPAERFDDAFRHFTRKRGSFWRWVRPVFEGATRSEANVRVEFRPLPGQPTVRDSVAFLALFAGLMEGLVAADHPVAALDWETARANFYAAMRDGLDADMEWIAADGDRTTDRAETYADLFDHARDGLTRRGLSRAAADEYLRPLRGRVRRGTTPARWKREAVADRVAAGDPLDRAIEGMQSTYVDRQRETLLTGSFLDWITETGVR